MTSNKLLESKIRRIVRKVLKEESNDLNSIKKHIDNCMEFDSLFHSSYRTPGTIFLEKNKIKNFIDLPIDKLKKYSPLFNKEGGMIEKTFLDGIKSMESLINLGIMDKIGQYTDTSKFNNSIKDIAEDIDDYVESFM